MNIETHTFSDGRWLRRVGVRTYALHALSGEFLGYVVAEEVTL
jgi:hypothetical protein